MKKLIILFTALSVVLSTVTAQTRYTAAVWKENASHTINPPIKNWKKDFSVTYEVDNSGEGYFCLIKHSPFFNTPPTPTTPPMASIFRAKITGFGYTFVVKDIYVVGDSAFFCGSCYDLSTHDKNAMWGYLNLNDFFTASVNVKFYKLQDGMGGVAPLLLDRLVAYNNGGRYNVVAYSRSSSPCSKIIEIQNADVPSAVCKTYDLPVSSPSVPMCVMYIDDISEDESNVIVSGHDISNPAVDVIWYGIYKKTDIYNSIVNNRTFLLSSSENPNGSVICAGMNRTGEFALSYTYYDNIMDAWYTRMRVINTVTGANVNSQQFAKDYKPEPLQMTYLPDLSSVELIQDLGSSAAFVQMFPFVSTSYTTSALNHATHYFDNIDAIEGHHFITCNGKNIYIQDRTMNLPASTAACPDNYSVKVDIIRNLSTTPTSFFPLDLICDRRSILTSVISDVLGVDCFSVE
jgi:hypothetical protein